MGIIEDIQTLCEELHGEAEFLKTLAGKAGDPRWFAVDPGYTRLKAMAQAQAVKVVAKAEELRAAIPD